MPDVPFVVYNQFIADLAAGRLDLTSDTLKVALTNRAPVPNTDTIFDGTTVPPPAAANGYPAGGNTVAIVSAATASAVFTLVLADSVFQAASGGIGPFRYVVLYDVTAGNRLIASYDYGLAVTLGYLEQFTTDFNDTAGVFTISVGP